MYEGLPTATNKLPVQERKSIPHHLLGCVKLEEKPWEVGTFRRNAIKVIKEIRSRGHLPILVGGTHYYTQALLFRDAILDDTGARHGKGANLEHKWPILGSSTENMLAELRRVDPAMAARWHPQDGRKIRRSLEIFLTTGRPASEIYEQQRMRKASLNAYEESKNSDGNYTSTDQTECLNPGMELPLLFDPLILWVHADPDVLRTRLDKRVDEMMERGLLSEAEFMHAHLQALEAKGIIVDQGCGIWTAIGYKEFKPYLEMYQSNLANDKPLKDLKQEGVELTRIATRQYAKYQARWIRLAMQKAVVDNHLETKFFLLDGTNLLRWSQDVDDPAARLTHTFLEGERLPLSKSLSDAADRLLVTSEKRHQLARYCQLCDKTMMSDTEWDQHVKGKKHTSALKPKIDWRALYPKNESPYPQLGD